VAATEDPPTPERAASTPPSPEVSGPSVEPARLDAFISYRRIPSDIEFVNRLQEALTARGKEVWVDVHSIEPAADWKDRIERGILGAKALIFVLTPESATSEECRNELETAARHHKLIIPIVLRRVDPHGLPEYLAKPNWIFLTQGDDFDTGIEEVIEALETDLDWRDAHTRLTVRTEEWVNSGRDRSFFLRGTDLRAAEAWLSQATAHLKSPPTALQSEYILASRKAADRAQRTWRAALAVGLVVALVLAGLALVQRDQARHEAGVAQSRALAAEATADLSTNPQQSLSLALRSTKVNASGPSEQALRLALAQARLRMVINPGTGSTTTAAWNPVRKQIAVTGPHATVELWNAQTGRMTASLPTVHGVAANQLLFDPTGTKLAAVAQTGYVSMWRITNHGTATSISTTVLNTLIRQDRTPAYSSSYPDLLQLQGVWDIKRFDEFVVFGWQLDNVLRFETQRGQTVSTFNPPLAYGSMTVVPSPDGTQLLVDTQVINLAARTSATLNSADQNPGPACWYADGSAIVTSTSTSAGGPILVSSPTGGDAVAQFNVLYGPPTALACSAAASDPWIAAGDSQGDADLRVPSGTVIPLYGHSDTINSIASSPDGRYLATASQDGTSRIWNASTGRLINTLTGDPNPIDHVAFGPGDGLVFTIDSGGQVRVWDTGVGQPITTLRRPRGQRVSALGFADHGREAYGIHAYSITASSGDQPRLTSISLFVWSTTTGKVIDSFPLPGVASLADPCTKALAELDGEMDNPLVGSQCNLPPPPSIATTVPIGPQSDYTAAVVAVAMNPNGKDAAYATPRSVVVVGPDGRRIATLHAVSPIVGLSYHQSSGELLVVTEKSVELWQPDSRHAPSIFPQTATPIDAEVSDAGNRLATVNVKGSVELWDVSNGTALGSFRPTEAHHGQSYFKAVPLRVALNADGTVVAAGNADGTVFLWNVSSKKIIRVSSDSGWPILQLTSSGNGSSFLAVDWAQTGSGGNASSSAEVLDATTGRVRAKYASPPAPLVPESSGAGLDNSGSVLFAGALGLAPAPPGGILAAYQISTGETLADLQLVSPRFANYFAAYPSDPWAPNGTELLTGNSIFTCDACGSLTQMQGIASSRLAWSRPRSAKSGRPPSSDPYY
jgi:WD40 repeat protein